jgi:hypothetical protein
MQLYSVPLGIDQQIEALLAEQIKAEESASKGYLKLYCDSQIKIERLQAALNSLNNN